MATAAALANFSTDSLVVEHHDKDMEFVVAVGQDKAFLNYEYLDKKTVDLYHTEVPDAFRGKGVGKILAKSAFDFVVDKNLKMKVTCTYLIKVLKDEPLEKYTKRVVS